jgi:hypothetical protein
MTHNRMHNIKEIIIYALKKCVPEIREVYNTFRKKKRKKKNENFALALCSVLLVVVPIDFIGIIRNSNFLFNF